MTHAELIDRAWHWLWSRWDCIHVMREPANQILIEFPDAIGWDKFGCSHLIECKTCPSDYYSDRRKITRREPHRGMGQFRWYLTPKGCLNPDWLKDGWGLAEIRKSRIVVVRKAEFRKEPTTYDGESERSLILRRYRPFVACDYDSHAFDCGLGI